MRDHLPNRFITLGTADGDHAPELAPVFHADSGESLAVEVDSHSFVRPNVIRSVDAALTLGIEVTARVRAMATLDRQTVAELRSRSCDSVSVGLDGHDAVTHDSYHGLKGAFASSVRSLEQAKHLGFDIYVVSRIHQADVNHLANMALLPQWLGAKAWFVTFASAPGVHGHGEPLSFARRRDVCAWLDDFAERHGQPIAVRCPECGSAAWLKSEVCVDPAEIAMAPCARRCTRSPIFHQAVKRLEEATA